MNLTHALMGLAVAAVAGIAMAPSASADPDGCYSTLNWPPSHVWCEAGESRVDCTNPMSEGVQGCSVQVRDGCFGTMDSPMSHWWCQVGPYRFDCYYNAATRGYDCE